MYKPSNRNFECPSVKSIHYDFCVKMFQEYILFVYSFSSVQVPSGGLAHLWCLVFSCNSDVGHHIAAGKVSFLETLGCIT